MRSERLGTFDTCNACAACAFHQSLVEGYEGCAGRTDTEMQGVRDLDTAIAKGERRSHGRRILHANIREGQKASDERSATTAADCFGPSSIQTRIRTLVSTERMTAFHSGSDRLTDV